MAKKRLSDAEKWDDPWFRNLPPLSQRFWLYLCDRCDAIGVWKVDFEMANFHLKDFVGTSWLVELNHAKERVVVFDDMRYWFIKDFCLFQYGKAPFNDIYKSLFLRAQTYTFATEILDLIPWVKPGSAQPPGGIKKKININKRKALPVSSAERWSADPPPEFSDLIHKLK